MKEKEDEGEEEEEERRRRKAEDVDYQVLGPHLPDELEQNILDPPSPNVDYQVLGLPDELEQNILDPPSVDYQVLGDPHQTEVDYQVLTPHLNLQDIHAFTESGLKGNVLRKF